MTPQVAQLDVYGLRVEVGGDWPEVVESLRLDFAWFETRPATEAADVEVAIERRPPDFDALPDVAASFVTPRNVVYQVDGRTIVDYSGQALAVLDRARGRLMIQGEEPQLVHEAAYQFLLSRAGEHLDARGLARMHGLGLAGAQGAVAVLLPSGGGKSVLALHALRADGVRLLSEDSPLLDRRGRLHPFPLPISVSATDADSLPAGDLRRIERMEFQPTYALELSAFADRIEREPQPLRHIVVGRRSLGREPRLERLPRYAGAGPLLREVVVGIGVYQGLEFVLQRGLWDVLGESGRALGRARCCVAGVAGARIWRLTLGRDRDRNWQALLPLLGSPT